jgi:DNA-binding IclR family transcriptional regulator
MGVKPQPDRGYSAPALEKGLEILEILAEASAALSQKQLADRLGRSVSEIFRMLSVLEEKGYVARNAEGGYLLTVKLYELAHRHPPLRRLVVAATPVLERLSQATGQSCYLVVLQGDDIVVVAQSDPATWRVLSVKLGARFSITHGPTSALVLAAYMNEPEREALLGRMGDRRGVEARLAEIVKKGAAVIPVSRIPGLIDVSAPVFDALGHVVAALSINYLPQRPPAPDIDRVSLQLREAAAEISRGLGSGEKPH